MDVLSEKDMTLCRMSRFSREPIYYIIRELVISIR